MSSSNFEVLAVRIGNRTATRSRVYLNYFYYGESDGEMPMDYYFWIIRDGARTVVVDTGFNERSGAVRNRTMTTPPAQALKHLGVDPETVEHVVLTHLHYDHSGNIDLFPEARFWIAKDELEFWESPFGARTLFESASESEDIAAVRQISAQGRLEQIHGEAEVLPGIRVIQVGGHTAGQTIVAVDTEAGEVLLASDAVHYHEELDSDRPFTESADLAGTYAAFDVIRARVKAGARLIPGHDPRVMQEYPPALTDYPELAVVVSRLEQE